MEEWNAVAGGVRPYVSVRLPCLSGDSWSDCSCSSELGTNQSKWGGLLSCLSEGEVGGSGDGGGGGGYRAY